MCLLYGGITLMHTVLTVAMFKEHKEKELTKGDRMAGISLIMGLSRFIYIILGPLLGVVIYESLSHNHNNLDKVNDLNTVTSCMDQYTTMDTSDLLVSLNEQDEDLHLIRNMWWASMAFFMLEACCGCFALSYFCYNKRKRPM